MPDITMKVNGRDVSGTVEGRTLLVEFLRGTLGLTGTHVGCDTGQCGACVVHVDGLATKACNVFAADLAGSEVTTIEAMANPDGSLGVIQAAFQTHHGLQCGFCTPGMVMVGGSAPEGEPEPDRARDSRISRRQPLPLYRLPQHRPGHRGSRGGVVGRTGRRRIASTGSGEAGAEEDAFFRETIMPKDSGIGAPLKRREDVRFLTGKGRYTDDINRPGQAHVHFLRSDVAHGRIRTLETDAAAAMPGVLKVFTSEDFKDAGSLPTAWLITSRDGSPQQEPRHPILAEDVVRHVGEAIAAVVAETLEQAEDAAEAIVVEIDDLPAVIDMKAALAADAPKVHETLSSNLCFDWGFIEDNKAKVDAAFETAHHVTTLELINNRCVANPMEPRCAVAEFDAGTDEYTLFTTSQNPHVIRLMMGAFVLHIPETKLRVVAPDVGGAFGSKIYHYGEEAFVTRAAHVLGRPVKWTSTRSEAFVTDAQGRDHVTKIQLALDKDGMFLAFRTETYANMGAYLRLFATVTPTYLHGPAAGGPYRTPLAYVNVKAVFTNTVPVDAYRGAGRPEGTYQLERLVDKAAREMGIDQAEIRRRNFVRPEEFPYQTPLAVVYDSGNYHATLDKLLEISDFAGFPARQAEAAEARHAARFRLLDLGRVLRAWRPRS